MNLRATSLLIQLFSGITSFVLCLSGRERDTLLLLVQLGENKSPVTSIANGHLKVLTNV